VKRRGLHSKRKKEKKRPALSGGLGGVLTLRVEAQKGNADRRREEENGLLATRGERERAH